MANFCTYCGTKLEKNAYFCTKCGNKIDEHVNKSNNSLLQIQSNDEKKKAKKELKRVCGGSKLNKPFRDELSKHGLLNQYYTENSSKVHVSTSIKQQVEKEIQSGQIKRGGVEYRVNELILQYKTNIEKQKKIIVKLFESKEIKSKIEEYDISESQLSSIKNSLQYKNFTKNEKEIKKEIKQDILNKLIEEIDKIKEKEFNKNRVKYIEDSIKDSCPNIQLTTFEKEYIDNLRLDYNIDAQLNMIAKGIINTRKRIGDYDFAGRLLEEGRFTTVGSELRFAKPVTQEASRTSNIFLKIFDNKIKIVGSEIKPYFSSSTGRDMTIYFADITSINYTNDLFGEIYFDLNNNTRLKLRDSEKDEKHFIDFYNFLNNTWDKFKNNENEKNISINEKDEVSTADELMKYAELYEKGLLTKEEFDMKKAELMGTSTVVSENIVPEKDVSPKFCGNCGNPIDSETKFCPDCGTQVKN